MRRTQFIAWQRLRRVSSIFYSIMNSILLLSILAIIKLSHCDDSTQDLSHKKDFDFLVFAQVWPISGCLEWEDRSDKNTCYLPSKLDLNSYLNWPKDQNWLKD